MNHRLTFSSILEEVPLKIRTNALLSAFLGRLAESKTEGLSGATGGSSAGSGSASVGSGSTGLEPSFSVLDLGTAGVTRNLEQIVEAVDNYRTEEGNLSYLSRQIARERAKAENYVTKRKEENQARVAQGLAPLPEDDVSRLFKIPPEPSRLESLLLLGQIDAYSKNLAVTASTGLVKMYAVQ
jgi:translation initiation factor 3 subunit H